MTGTDLAGLRTAVLTMRYHAASAKFELAILRMAEALKSNPRWFLQPRVPRGQREGGQWVSALLGVDTLDPNEERVRVAQSMGRATFSGVLVRHNYVRSTNTSICTYYNSREYYYFVRTYVGDYCPFARIHY